MWTNRRYRPRHGSAVCFQGGSEGFFLGTFRLGRRDFAWGIEVDLVLLYPLRSLNRSEHWKTSVWIKISGTFILHDNPNSWQKSSLGDGWRQPANNISLFKEPKSMHYDQSTLHPSFMYLSQNSNFKGGIICLLAFHWAGRDWLVISFLSSVDRFILVRPKASKKKRSRFYKTCVGFCAAKHVSWAPFDKWFIQATALVDGFVSAGRRQTDGRLVFDDHRQSAPVVVWVSQMVQKRRWKKPEALGGRLHGVNEVNPVVGGAWNDVFCCSGSYPSSP